MPRACGLRNDKKGRKTRMGTRKPPDTFPARLQYLREKRGISRLVLGELCGLSKNVIALYERGEGNPTMSSLLALADFFEVTVDFLICRENTK